MNKYLIFLFLVSIHYLNAQTPVANYKMDCDVSDNLSAFGDLQSAFFPSCECGVDNDGFLISGSTELTVDTSVSYVFDSDFAVSFYFQATSNSNSQELLSLGDNCSSDSLLRVYYLADMNEIVFEVSESIQESISLSATLPSNRCWNHIIISRDANDFFLYVNGELAEDFNSNSDIRLNITEPIRIGNGPCVGVISNVFTGLIDELEIFEEHIQAFRAQELYFPTNEILSSDTTIFEGDIIDLNATNSCNNPINWFPSTGIANTTSPNTTVEGIESINYIAQFNGNYCISTDTISIFVINPNDVQCSELLLPNVFTPNGDGLNDDFGILNKFIVEDLNYFEIYDRWGEKVFSATNKQARWDGSFNDKPVNSNLFLYKISYTCGSDEYVKTGSVSILR